MKHIYSFVLLILSMSMLKATDVTVRLLDETSINTVSGAAAQVYMKLSSSGSYSLQGTTTNGALTIAGVTPGNYDFYVNYNYSRQYMLTVAVSGTSQNLDYQTTKVTINLNNCSGLVNTNAAYIRLQGNINATYYGIGYTSGGSSSIYLLPVSHGFQMDYNYSRETQALVAVSGTTQSVDFNATCVTVNLNNCSGVVNTNSAYVRLQGNINGTYYGMGYTSAGSLTMDLLGGDYSFQMDYNYSRQTLPTETVSGSSYTRDFNATCVTVDLEDCNGLVNTNSAYVRMQGNINGTYYGMGYTSAGTLNLDLLPGDYTFQMDYNNSRQSLATQTISGLTGSATFTSSCVTVNLNNCSGLVNTNSAYIRLKGNINGTFYGMGYTSGGSLTLSLMAGTYDFMMDFNNGRQTMASVSVVGTSTTVDFTATCVSVNLNNCSGLVNTNSAYVRMQGNINGTYYGMGYTSAGTLNLDLLPGDYSFQMDYNNSRQTLATQTISGVNQTVDFTATCVTVNMDNCGSIVNTNAAYLRLQGNLTTSYYNQGFTTAGTYLIDLLPGDYVFQMEYNYYRANDTQTITGSNQTVNFAVSNVDINYTGSVTYQGNINASYHTYSRPMFLLEGMYNFRFGGTYDATLTVSGCNMSSSAVIVQLINSSNTPLAGGVAEYYNSGVWTSIGTTSLPSGSVLLLMPGTPGNVIFRLSYQHGTQQLQQNVSLNPVVVFQTRLISVELRNSGGSLMDPGTNVQYYSGSWYQFGSGATSGGLVTMELLPLNYYYRMTYANYQQQQGPTAAQTITFQTQLQTVELRNAAGNLMDQGTNVQYYSGNWYTFGTGVTSGGQVTMELLPGSYYFRMTFANNTQQQGPMNILSNPVVVFQTKLVTLLLKNSYGQLVDPGTNVQYYTGTWYTFGSGATSGGKTQMELLPGSYYYRLTYAGQQTQQGPFNLNTKDTIVFGLHKVTIRLMDQWGYIGDLGTNLGYFPGTWLSFGTGSTNGGIDTMQLLQASYHFRLTYLGTQFQKGPINITSDSIITFLVIAPTPLPVDWLAVSAKNVVHTTNQVNWKVASSINNEYFEVLRSLDGKEFTYAGTVKANEYSSQGSYSFTDVMGELPTGKYVYYRIRQVDIDGNSSVSPTALASMTHNATAAFEVKVWPNPAESLITIVVTDESTSPAVITIADQNGRTLITPLVQNGQVDISAYPAGIYYVHVVKGAQSHTEKIVKL